jgi:hypothetical protein
MVGADDLGDRPVGRARSVPAGRAEGSDGTYDERGLRVELSEAAMMPYVPFAKRPDRRVFETQARSKRREDELNVPTPQLFSKSGRERERNDRRSH